MEYNEIIIITRIVTGAIGAFFSIVLWSKTREPAWIFVIIGALCIYVEVVFTTLEVFGILSGDMLTFFGIPFLKLLLLNLPVIFITIGFIMVIAGNRRT
jgi:hypothetical protein